MDERIEQEPGPGTAAIPVASTAWDAFERELAAALPLLRDECLVLLTREGNRYVQFAGSPERGLFAETVSNAFLAPGDRLDEPQEAALQALGWSPPTHAPDAPSPVPPPAGSPNHFREFPVPFSPLAAARLAVRTLVEVHGVPGPEALWYDASDHEGNAVLLPGLRLRPRPSSSPRRRRRARRPPAALARLKGQVARAARRVTGLASLEFRGDGDLVLPLGSRTATIRVDTSPCFVRAYAQLAAGVEGDDELPGRAHEVNVRLALARVVLCDGAVYLAIDFPAAPFHADHLAQALSTLGRLADGVARDLGLAGASITPTVN
jgi:hypothetical protein